MSIIELHASNFDALLRANELSKKSTALVFGTVTLVDENGEVLVDENGEELVATISNYQTYMLHALPDDFTLQAK